MHFGDQNAGFGAGSGIGGPEAGIGVARGKLLGDGDGFGDHHTIGGTHRRGGATGEVVAQHGGKLVGIKPGAVGFDGQVKGVEQQPAAQRPAGIGVVADHKIIGHGSFPFSATLSEPGLDGK